MKSLIPFTDARRERLAKLGLRKRLGGHEALLQIEYEDGTEIFKPADWSADEGCWVSVDDERFYVAGEGRSSGALWGTPVVHVHAAEAGVISAEATLVANREDEGRWVDEDGRELEVVEWGDDGDPELVEYADGGPDAGAGEASEEIAADGGTTPMRVGEDVSLHFDMEPPAGYDGEVIPRGKAGYYDPYPVSRQDADTAVAIAENAAHDESKLVRYLLMGLGAGAGIVIVLLIIQWLMGQIGGSTAGGGGGGGGGQGEQLAAQAKFTLQAMGAI